MGRHMEWVGRSQLGYKMVERHTEWSQCYKTGKGTYNQGKFEEDFW